MRKEKYMRNRIIKPAVAFIALLTALTGCIQDGGVTPPEPTDPSITLGVDLPRREEKETGSTRAAVDEWDNTPVSIAYFFEPGVYYDRSLTVTVEDAGGQHIKTGMEYPSDQSIVSFRGYHPVQTPSETGTVSYDITGGDIDVMVSNPVEGKINNQITDKLRFEHQLTRVTFRLKCATNDTSYPEPVFGITAEASTTTKFLGTWVVLDLGSSTDPVFKSWGSVFSGDKNGFVVPAYQENPVVVEMMVQPLVPLKFTVVSLTGFRDITVPIGNAIWNELTTVGGAKGYRYNVDLNFSGESIIAQGISMTPWADGGDLISGNQSWW
jgi:hypothetical protein